jgi:hypothetical protein
MIGALTCMAKECLQEEVCDVDARNGAAFEVAQREKIYLHAKDE